MDRARILVVEAEEPVALAIKDCLERLGYEVPDVLATGEEAAEKSVTLAADLVLIGAHLSGAMSGTGCRASDQGFHRRTRGPSELPLRHSHRALRVRFKPIEERSLEATVKMASSDPEQREQEARAPRRGADLRRSHDRGRQLLCPGRGRGADRA